MHTADNPQFGQVIDKKDLVVLFNGNPEKDHMFYRRGCGSHPDKCSFSAEERDIYCRMLNPTTPIEVVVVGPDGSKEVNQQIVSGDVYCDFETEVVLV